MRNLILVWQPRWQIAQDFEEIASIITASAPDIEVFVVNNETTAFTQCKKAAKKPTLIVSLAALWRPVPRRGKIYQGSFVSKTDQKSRLSAVGIPVPKGIVLEPNLELDPDEWGEFVIVKPLDAMKAHSGLGVNLVRTVKLHYRPPKDYPEEHPGHHGPMLAEQFIDTGEWPTYYRVFTLFGEPLHAIEHRTLNRRPPLDSADDEIAKAAINVSQGFIALKFVDDTDLLELARNIYPAMAEVPFHACDIVRDIHTKKLYVIELNPGQNAMRISSEHWKEKRKLLGGRDAMIKQFGAWEKAAKVLIERTRAEAE